VVRRPPAAFYKKVKDDFYWLRSQHDINWKHAAKKFIAK
jgi:hypothetical protein